VVEPAFPSLRRAHDTTVHGRRRYRRPGLRALLTRAGLSVTRTTYAYAFLAPPAAALALADRARGRPAPPADGEGTASDVERRALDPVFGPLAGAERRALHRVDLPVGTSVLAVAVRR
jgi:hypothetical protein